MGFPALTFLALKGFEGEAASAHGDEAAGEIPSNTGELVEGVVQAPVLAVEL